MNILLHTLLNCPGARPLLRADHVKSKQKENVASLNFTIGSLPHLLGCIDFRDGLINLSFAAGPLLSQECRYLLITPLQNGKLMMEEAL